jgi:acyl-CoA synthetase (AMP-forming)/AMP-acid ligase II
MAWGNGMRPDVWEPFRQRFGIPIIHELYAATDGMGSMFNLNKGEFSRHAIGVRGLLWNMINGPREKIVRIDVDTQEILRDPKTGFATECPRGEAGETIHWIDPAAPLARVHFQGYYKNEEATKKRFIRDVFQKDDMWFRSGDMMRQEETGCVYFADRLGDTYRWKSENVSTNEVSALLGQFPGIAECNVYGVLVPNADGRAGCAALVLSEDVKFDFKGLAEHALAQMPRYAVPVFLRLTSALGYTSTMKLQKGKLRQEGCDIEKAEASGDKLYWLPPNKANYVPFTREEFSKIQNGQIQL